MKKLLLIFVFFSLPAAAEEHFLASGEHANFSISVDLEKGAMFVLPKIPRSVTGKTRPYFQVEVYGEKMMVTPLQAGARTNLFIDFGDKTIATLRLVAVNGGGEDLVSLVLREPPAPKRIPLERPDFPSDLKFLAAPWTMRRLGSAAHAGALLARVEYVATVGDHILLPLKLSNQGPTPLTITEINVSLETLGGMKGTTALAARPVPTSFHLENATLAKGESVFGMAIIPKVSLDHDQVLVLRVTEENVPGPEVRISL